LRSEVTGTEMISALRTEVSEDRSGLIPDDDTVSPFLWYCM